MNRRTERGSVSLWLVLASFAMTLLVGLAVDLGGQVHAQQRAHNLAAHAARAAGQEVRAASAIAGRQPAVDTAAARNAALHYLTSAGVAGTVDIRGGDTITVTVTDIYRPKFLGLIGITRLDVTGHASARLVRSLGGNEP